MAFTLYTIEEPVERWLVYWGLPARLPWTRCLRQRILGLRENVRGYVLCLDQPSGLICWASHKLKVLLSVYPALPPARTCSAGEVSCAWESASATTDHFTEESLVNLQRTQERYSRAQFQNHRCSFLLWLTTTVQGFCTWEFSLSWESVNSLALHTVC